MGNLFNEIPYEIIRVISEHHSRYNDKFGCVDFERDGDRLSTVGERRFFDTARWMEDGFEQLEPSRGLMDFLCRGDFLQPIGRLVVYHLFLWDCTGSEGFVARSRRVADSDEVITDSWVIKNPAPSLQEILKFLKDLVRWLFWVGIFVTGWGKMAHGLMTLYAVKCLETKRDGKTTANLELLNLMTDQGFRKQGFGSAHMVAICALGTKLDLPVKLAVPDPENVKFYELFGFVSQGRIPGLPKKHPWYIWMVYEPRNNPMNEERARQLLHLD